MIPEHPRLEPQRFDLAPLPTAVVRRQAITIDAIRELFDTGFAALARAGIEPAGPAFAIYRGDPTAVFDAEIGFPLTRPLPGRIEGSPAIEPATLPAGPTLALTHLGPYDSLGDSWAKLLAAVMQRVGTHSEVYVEFYVTQPSPEADPASMRTELFTPISE